MSDFALHTQLRQLWDNPVLDLVFLQWTMGGKILEMQGAEIA